MAEEIRTFIAVELEVAVRQALGELQARLKRQPAGRLVRWVAPDGIHLTLKFLGNVERDRLTVLHDAVREACAGILPFVLKLEGVGAFPNTRRPNVIWIGAHGDTQASRQLAERIEGACGRLGFAREERAFSPHLTLGRVKRDTPPADRQFIGKMVETAGAGELGELRVDHVSIIKSELRPTGSVYTRLYEVELV